MMVAFIEGFMIIGVSCFEMYKLIFVYVCSIDAFNNEVATAIRDCYININLFTM